MPRFQQRSLLVLGLAVGALFLYLALRGTSLAEISEALSGARLGLAAPLVAAYALTFWIKAYRWGLLLSGVRRFSVGELFKAIMIGYLAALALPAYLGELARAFVLCRRLRLGYAPVLATLFVERLFDFLCVLLFLAVVLVVEDRIPVELMQAGWFLLGVGLALLLCTLIALFWSGAVLAVARRLAVVLPERWRQPLLAELDRGLSALDSIRGPRRLLQVVASTALYWAVMAGCISIALAALDLEVPASAGIVVMGLIVAGMSLPNTPGFVGTIQFCFTLGLEPFGVAAAEAFAASLFFHVLVTLLVVVAGLVYLHQAGYALAEIKEGAEAAKADR